MARSVNQHRYEQRRIAILEHAYAQFGAFGYEGTTTAAICRAAGISSGTFFHYFPTKRDVVIEILRAGNDATKRQLDQIEARGLEAVEAYAAMYSAELRDPSLGGFVHAIAGIEHLPSVEALLREGRALTRTFLCEQIASARSDAAIRTDVSTDELATWLHWLFDGAAEDAVAGSPVADDLSRATRALLVPS